MNKCAYKFLVRASIAIAAALPAAKVDAESVLSAEQQVSREYQVKAAFIYNFMKFTEWPEDKNAGDVRVNSKPKTMVIGVIGKDPFGNAFDPILNKTVGGRKIIIKRFVGVSSRKDMSESRQKHTKDYAAKYAQSLKKCHVLFICDSEHEFIADILTMIESGKVLTFCKKEGYLEKGTMVRFVKKGEKLRFEINLKSIKKSHITISSKLLKLAVRIIKNETEK